MPLKIPQSSVAKKTKSGRQRRTDIKTKRRTKAEKLTAARVDPRLRFPGAGTAPCNPLLLAPNNSYGPMMVLKGYYEDATFQCKDCGKQEIWTATQQKWWYEIAKGNVDSRAVRCRNCRRKERERVAEARRIHQEGLARKRAAKS